MLRCRVMPKKYKYDKSFNVVIWTNSFLRDLKHEYFNVGFVLRFKLFKLLFKIAQTMLYSS